jgi:hypothetical protein
VTAGSGCPIPVAPVCDLVSGAGTGLAKDALSAIVSWIVAGASWLLDQLGSVMASSTTVDLKASWFHQHYAAMVAIAAVVAVPMLFFAAIQALYRQSPGVLVRAAFVHLPLAGLLTAVAIQLVQLSLSVTDALCSMVAQGTGNDIDETLKSVATVLVTSGASLPGFVLGIGAVLVVLGALALWLEMIVRSAAVYVAVLFLPLAMASLVWPALSHWCRRLVEALVSIVLSKFVVVAVLSLAVGALANGSGFATLLTAGALLLLASFMPFTLLRLVPMIESGAALQLEGARQRFRQAYGAVPRSAASFAMSQAVGQAMNRARSAKLALGVPGTGTDIDPGAPGSDHEGPAGDSGGADAAGASGVPGGPDGGPEGGGAAALLSGGGGSGTTNGRRGGEGGWSAGGGTGEELTETRRKGLWPLGRMPPDAAPGPREFPPGDIPAWEPDMEFTNAVLDAALNPPQNLVPYIPDSVGGLPGVECPLYGNTVPRSRFEPGPKDDWWTAEEEMRSMSGHGGVVWTPRRWAPSQPPLETPEDAFMWDRAVRRDTKGDDAF